MKIAILHPDFSDSTAPYKDSDVDCDAARLLAGHDVSEHFIRKSSAVRQVIALSRENYDIFVNMCDGSWGEDTPGIEVVQALEKEGCAFTGASAKHYEPSRVAMKMAAHSAAVKFPAYVQVRSAEDITYVLETLRFPMFVKHPESYSSVGLTRDSRVTDTAGLEKEIHRMLAEYHGALVEEFVEGREFTVLVTEPADAQSEPWVLNPVEFTFPPNESFKHYDLKWVDYEQMDCLPVADEALAKRLRLATGAIFSALGTDGYARCDFRMTPGGEIFFLEINPNCGIFYPVGSYGSADFILQHDGGHKKFIEHIISCGLRRQKRSREPFRVRYRREAGFGLFADRSIAAGSTIQVFEERAHYLVSRAHSQKVWPENKRQLFGRYTWPVSANVHVMWSDISSEWRPINHACDPNTWLEGLNVVARRAIASGEQLTLDYATFCGPEMETFNCSCGSTNCRGKITGNDWSLPELQSRYQNHFSDYLTSLIKPQE